ncbi:hypothetical protein BDV25DRAFT_93909 [Aspergillus avenaceus]|uniref:Geranylgeranyl pyrophosphate synthetase n=1 Tax=Aspergillus avenaceus TaxID=36643 RepID=A0A5N6U7W6_ASPAV|nr:hypothetical protein BDV25DRAFT_93909 [Aspergillus avenaceus]
MPAPTKLSEDKGEFFRDINAARYPSYPLQPAVNAILKTNEDFACNEVDIFTCASAMGNLLRFVRGVDKEFRIIVEVIGSTAFFLRRENSPIETIPNVRGYGHTFPEASTTWEHGVKGSETHQRMVQYTFSGLTCVVRVEVDGYLSNLPLRRDQHVAGGDTGVDEQLISALQGSAVTPHKPQGAKRGLSIQSGGQEVPQSALFDLKTRSFRRKDTDILDEELPRLWVRQIPTFILGFHEYGVFNDVRVQYVREDVERWEKANEDSLRRFASLLHTLIDFAIGHPDGRFEVVHEEGKSAIDLRDLDQDVGHVLPEELKDRWVTGSTAAAKSINSDRKLSAEASDSSEKKTDLLISWESSSEEDFTACSSTCGYCGHCGK